MTTYLTLAKEAKAASAAARLAREEWQRRQQAANRLVREAREAQAQEVYGVPAVADQPGEYRLFMASADGSAIYRHQASTGGGRNFYLLREPDGTESFVGRSQNLIPKRGYKKVKLV
jgi:hypothetical protein